jgi:hypothetical protein
LALWQKREANTKRVFTEIHGGRGGAALEQVLPSLDDKLFTLKSDSQLTIHGTLLEVAGSHSLCQTNFQHPLIGWEIHMRMVKLRLKTMARDAETIIMIMLDPKV